MAQSCFYCANDTDERETHQVTFHVINVDREEILCHDCYQEWLQGIKG